MRGQRSVRGAAAADEETASYAGAAERLGVAFAEAIPKDCPVTPAKDGEPIRQGRAAISTAGKGAAFFAPTEADEERLAAFLALHPAEAERIRITTPRAIRRALMAASADGLARQAIERLPPLFSARQVASAPQVAAGLILVMLLVIAAVADLGTALLALNFTGGVLFFAVALLRFVAAKRVAPRIEAPTIWRGDEGLPVYSVLVPLYREAHLADEIVAMLRRLDWPADRLDVKLLVEADDPATRRAAERAAGGTPFEVVTVPPLGPRTKPKALAFALPLCRGGLVTVYDAEDRPHPEQLREAYAAFAAAGPELACLQAPLLIENEPGGPIARFFALEYSALFDGLLPMLADFGLPLPLGGTSNHFRREALEKIGGWDPFNVTEDADLGIRLARCGYRSGTLRLPTIEEAPPHMAAWLRQRTRWFKGWIQTWLVHTRQPLRLASQIGIRQLAGFVLVGIGMLVSAMIHPVYLGTLIAVAADPARLWGGGAAGAAMLGINLFNFFAGYLAMAILARRTMALRGRGGEAWLLLALPLYWLLMSVAGYRAVGQLIVRPHHWDKTPHRGRGHTAAPAEAQRPRPAALRRAA